jgi:hypothetical protein
MTMELLTCLAIGVACGLVIVAACWGLSRLMDAVASDE